MANVVVSFVLCMIPSDSEQSLQNDVVKEVAASKPNKSSLGILWNAQWLNEDGSFLRMHNEWVIEGWVPEPSICPRLVLKTEGFHGFWPEFITPIHYAFAFQRSPRWLWGRVVVLRPHIFFDNVVLKGLSIVIGIDSCIHAIATLIVLLVTSNKKCGVCKI